MRITECFEIKVIWGVVSNGWERNVAYIFDWPITCSTTTLLHMGYTYTVCNLLYIFGTDSNSRWNLDYVTCFFRWDCYIQKSVKFKNRFLKGNKRFPEITRNMCCMYAYVVT